MGPWLLVARGTPNRQRRSRWRHGEPPIRREIFFQGPAGRPTAHAGAAGAAGDRRPTPRLDWTQLNRPPTKWQRRPQSPDSQEGKPDPLIVGPTGLLWSRLAWQVNANWVTSTMVGLTRWAFPGVFPSTCVRPVESHCQRFGASRYGSPAPNVNWRNAASQEASLRRRCESAELLLIPGIRRSAQPRRSIDRDRANGKESAAATVRAGCFHRVSDRWRRIPSYPEGSLDGAIRTARRQPTSVQDPAGDGGRCLELSAAASNDGGNGSRGPLCGCQSSEAVSTASSGRSSSPRSPPTRGSCLCTTASLRASLTDADPWLCV